MKPTEVVVLLVIVAAIVAHTDAYRFSDVAGSVHARLWGLSQQKAGIKRSPAGFISNLTCGAVGAHCDAFALCNPSAYCDPVSGTCKVGSGPGEACTSPKQCHHPIFGMICEQGKCRGVSVYTGGEDCNRATSLTGDFGGCLPGDLLNVTCTNGRCSPYYPTGAHNGATDDYGDSVCPRNATMFSDQCQYVVQAEQDNSGGTSPCVANTFSNGTHCVAPFTVLVGGPCAGENADLLCVKNAECKAGVCTTVSGLGQKCTVDSYFSDNCSSTSFCNPGSGVCELIYTDANIDAAKDLFDCIAVNFPAYWDRSGNYEVYPWLDNSLAPCINKWDTYLRLTKYKLMDPVGGSCLPWIASNGTVLNALALGAGTASPSSTTTKPASTTTQPATTDPSSSVSTLGSFGPFAIMTMLVAAMIWIS